MQMFKDEAKVLVSKDQIPTLKAAGWKLVPTGKAAKEAVVEAKVEKPEEPEPKLEIPAEKMSSGAVSEVKEEPKTPVKRRSAVKEK